MADKITPYKDTSRSKKEQVAAMFDTISGNYDGLNRVISFGVDVHWRKKVVQLVKKTGAKRLLDIATGTGDLAIALSKTNATQIIGLDISQGMLDVGKKKISNKNLDHLITLVKGDSEQLPYADHHFDGVTVAFGVRNFEHLEKGLSEIYRVLAPGGSLTILETSLPTKTPYKQGYKIYCSYILPTIGKIFSKDRSAYAYLSESAAAFPYGQAFNNILKKIGFNSIEDRPQTFGVATIYTATK